ncbi:MAG: hypothetical protein HKN68_04845 [Saprospiraceae bacterium]|nr:hypothetical protein [Saprospiraceae bacterium]
MKKLLFLSLIALATILLYSCQKENLYSDSEDTELQIRAKKNTETPFKGTYTTYPRIINEGPGFLEAVVESEGNATHLGKSEWYGEGYIDLLDEPPSQVGPCYFVSANKDTLFGNYVGTIALFDTNPVFTGEGTYEITHGTGRFIGTTGYGVYEYEVNLQEDFTFKGELIWDGVLINP